MKKIELHDSELDLLIKMLELTRPFAIINNSGKYADELIEKLKAIKGE